MKNISALSLTMLDQKSVIKIKGGNNHDYFHTDYIDEGDTTELPKDDPLVF